MNCLLTMLPHYALVNVLRQIACIVDIGRIANVSRSFFEAMFDPHTWKGRILHISDVSTHFSTTMQCKLQKAWCLLQALCLNTSSLQFALTFQMIPCVQIYELEQIRHRCVDNSVVKSYCSQGLVPDNCYFSCLPPAHTTLNILLSDRSDFHDKFVREIMGGVIRKRILWISLKIVAGRIHSWKSFAYYARPNVGPKKAKGWIPPRVLGHEAVVFGVHFYNESVTIAIPSINEHFTISCPKGISLRRRMSIHCDSLGHVHDCELTEDIQPVSTNLHTAAPFWFSST